MFKLLLVIPMKGSYRCGHCKAGYIGNQTVGCHLQQDLCPDMVTVCDVNANCIATYFNEYSCKVNIDAMYHLKKIL